MVGDWKYS